MVGIGVYDFICKDQYDSETGETYKALSCCNDEDMAIRCKVKDAKKVVWSVKATQSFNNEICILLRNGIQNGKINLPVKEQNIEDYLKDTYKGFVKLTNLEQTQMKMAYLQTTMAIFELIKLDHEIKNGQIKIKEVAGNRKDRYSSIAYNYWCMIQLEMKLKPHNNSGRKLVDRLPIKTAKRISFFE